VVAANLLTPALNVALSSNRAEGHALMMEKMHAATIDVIWTQLSSIPLAELRERGKTARVATDEEYSRKLAASLSAVWASMSEEERHRRLQVRDAKQRQGDMERMFSGHKPGQRQVPNMAYVPSASDLAASGSTEVSGEVMPTNNENAKPSPMMQDAAKYLAKQPRVATRARRPLVGLLSNTGSSLVQRIADGTASIDDQVQFGSTRMTPPFTLTRRETNHLLQKILERKDTDRTDKASKWEVYQSLSSATGNRAMKKFVTACHNAPGVRKFCNQVLRDRWVKIQLRGYPTAMAASSVHKAPMQLDHSATKVLRLLISFFTEVDGSTSLRFKGQGDRLGQSADLRRTHNSCWGMLPGLTNNRTPNSTRTHQRIASSPGVTMMVDFYEHPDKSQTLESRLRKFGVLATESGHLAEHACLPVAAVPPAKRARRA